MLSNKSVAQNVAPALFYVIHRIRDCAAVSLLPTIHGGSMKRGGDPWRNDHGNIANRYRTSWHSDIDWDTLMHGGGVVDWA